MSNQAQPASTTPEHGNESSSTYELYVGLLTIISIVGMVLMTFGIGIFGVLTSFMSSLFLAPKNAVAASATETDTQLQADIAALRREIAELNLRLQERRPGNESLVDAH